MFVFSMSKPSSKKVYLTFLKLNKWVAESGFELKSDDLGPQVVHCRATPSSF
jgi:hypothetical protein